MGVFRTRKKMKTKKYLLLLFVMLFCCFSLLVGRPAHAGSKKPIIREEIKVIVDGVQERWYLEWEKPPVSACGPDEADWYTCPCFGFAFGEAGYLNLVRQRTGHKDERFSLTDLFKAEEGLMPGRAVLRRWDKRKDDHIEDSGKPAFISRVKARHRSRVMYLKDYDHDGRATEFILQTGTLPCGKEMSVVVGLSRKKPYLHVFTSLKNPAEPLILQRCQWEALAKARTSIKVVQWPCGDHASEEEVAYDLKADNGGIRAVRRVYQCNDNDLKRGTLKESKEF